MKEFLSPDELNAIWKEKELIIFDFDGTLLDSMPMWKHLGSEYIMSQGITPPSDLDEKLVTMTLEQSGMYYIKELGLVKISDGEGNYYYALGRRDDSNLEKRYQAVFVQSLKSVDYAGHITCIRCHTGMANAACAALDTMGFAGVVGTLAGDDTIFVLMRSEEQAKAMTEQISNILQER